MSRHSEARIDQIFGILKAKSTPAQKLQAADARHNEQYGIQSRERGRQSELRAKDALEQLPFVAEVIITPDNGRSDMRGIDLIVHLVGLPGPRTVHVQVKSSNRHVREGLDAIRAKFNLASERELHDWLFDHARIFLEVGGPEKLTKQAKEALYRRVQLEFQSQLYQILVYRLLRDSKNRIAAFTANELFAHLNPEGKWDASRQVHEMLKASKRDRLMVWFKNEYDGAARCTLKYTVMRELDGPRSVVVERTHRTSEARAYELAARHLLVQLNIFLQSE